MEILNQDSTREPSLQGYPLSFRLANKLYHRNFGLYRRLYFPYKKLSDRRWISRVRETVEPGMTVLDIGANIGFYTRLLSSLAGDDGHVHAFEPEAENFGHLQSLAGSLPNVTVCNKAVAEVSKKSRLYRSRELNVDHQMYDIGEGRDAIEIDCISIDDYFAAGETVDFIKLDVQGYDYHAAQGMRETISRSGRVILMSEFWPYGMKQAGADPLGYIKFLESLGFETELEDVDPRDAEALRQKTDDKFFYTTFWAVRKG